MRLHRVQATETGISLVRSVSGVQEFTNGYDFTAFILSGGDSMFVEGSRGIVIPSTLSSLFLCCYVTEGLKWCLSFETCDFTDFYFFFTFCRDMKRLQELLFWSIPALPFWLYL